MVWLFSKCILILCLWTLARGDDHCHTDTTSESCKEIRPRPCRVFDREEVKHSKSLITYFPMGRLGNTISAYLTLLWLKKDHDLDVYFDRSSFKTMQLYFENIGGGIKVLEDQLCDWKEFGFVNFEEDIHLLTTEAWRIGKAINIHPDTEEVKKNKRQTARNFANIYRPETKEALRMKPKFVDHTEAVFKDVAKKLGKPVSDIVFVGIHNRRTDYLPFRKNVLGMRQLRKSFFFDAIDYFRDEYENVAFLFVSDDMAWGKKKLSSKYDDVFFVGCGTTDDVDCIGKDFSLVSSCNHTVISNGSFGFWAGVLAGGEIYTEYGTIVPQSFTSSASRPP